MSTTASMTIPIPAKGAVIPLIIDGEDVGRSTRPPVASEPELTTDTSFLSANPELATRAVDAAAAAFPAWSRTSIPERRTMFNKMAQMIRDNAVAIKQMIAEEIHCEEKWGDLNILLSLGIIEESAAAMSSEAMAGQVMPTVIPGAYPLVVNEPYGVVLGMAPWNAPLILGLRAVCAPLAAGNTTVFRGSEISPRTHYFVADLVRRAGFPRGACNLILNSPGAAAGVFDACIRHPAVKKVNFTGSTAVGREVAVAAAKHLKPVLLELGGKNVSIVLEDADWERAARLSLDAALNGQVCMSTDTIMVHHSIAAPFTARLRELIASLPVPHRRVISSKSQAKIASLLDSVTSHSSSPSSSAPAATAPAPATANATNKIFQAPDASGSGNLVPVTLVENLAAPGAEAWHATEAFGPVVAVQAFGGEDEAVDVVRATGYGLSAAVFSRDVVRALALARRLDVGAVHVNGGTAYDEASLPHGGCGLSGYGRFGGPWAIREFTRTKTIMIYP